MPTNTTTAELAAAADSDRDLEPQPAQNELEPDDIAYVRNAAEALKQAVDRHLAVVESGPAATAADLLDSYIDLAESAELYDAALFEVHGEVTPFDQLPDPQADYVGPDELGSFSLFIRRDYRIADPALLAGALGYEGEPSSDPGVPTRILLETLLDFYSEDEIAEHAGEFGLETGATALWGSAAQQDLSERGYDAPFLDATGDLTFYRWASAGLAEPPGEQPSAGPIVMPEPELEIEVVEPIAMPELEPELEIEVVDEAEVVEAAVIPAAPASGPVKSKPAKSRRWGSKQTETVASDRVAELFGEV